MARPCLWAAGALRSLNANIAILHRHVRHPALCTERLTDAQDKPCAILYLQEQAAPERIQAVRAWIQSRGEKQSRCGKQGMTAWWKTAADWLRLPPVMETDSPAETAAALRNGGVAILDDHPPGARLAPLTLALMLGSPRDEALPPSMRGLARWSRLLAAVSGLLLSAAFVAISAYHHSLIPGPFLMALASARQNLPFPIVMEILLVELLGDGIRDGVLRLGGRQLVMLAYTGVLLAVMVAVQAGMLGAVSGVVGITSATLTQALSNRALRRTVRVWRYLFIAAAAGLGLYGVALLVYLMFVYLGDEKPFGHHLWLPLKVRSWA